MTRSLPLTRAGCVDGPRPCPHATCRHFLEGAESCSLDVAARGGVSLDEVATLLGVSRPTIGKIEASALKRLCRDFGMPVPAREDFEPDIETNNPSFAVRDATDARIFAAVVAVERGTAKEIAAAASEASPQLVHLSLHRLMADGLVVRERAPGRPPTYIYELVQGEAAE